MKLVGPLVVFGRWLSVWLRLDKHSPGVQPHAYSPPLAATPSPLAPSLAPPSARATPSASASENAGAAPAELQSNWTTTLDSGQQVTLTISATTYAVRRGPNAARGSLSVNGDQIEFFGGSACALRGLYTWTLTDDELAFDAGADECPGRAQVISEQTYDRAP